MNVTTIERGILSEIELVKLFATEKQQTKYESSGNKFTGLNKKTVLKQAANWCEIKDLGKRKYEIVKVYDYPEPKVLAKMHSGIHQYLTPLILINLIREDIYKLDSYTTTCAKWHRMIGMINRNFFRMKYSADYSSSKLDVSKEVARDFFEHTYDSLVYFFKKSLEYLKSAGLFEYERVHWLCIRERRVLIGSHGKRTIQIDTIHRRAEPEDMEYIQLCSQIACQYAGIASDKPEDKRIGDKAEVYANKFRELMMKRGIAYFYKAFEIRSIDKDIQRCNHLLKSFKNVDNKEELIKNLNRAYQKHLLTNMKKRITKKAEQGSLSRRAIKRFTQGYKKIMKMTLEYDASNIEVPNVLDESSEEDINKIISDNIHISFNGKTVNIGVDSENN